MQDEYAPAQSPFWAACRACEGFFVFTEDAAGLAMMEAAVPGREVRTYVLLRSLLRAVWDELFCQSGHTVVAVCVGRIEPLGAMPWLLPIVAPDVHGTSLQLVPEPAAHRRTGDVLRAHGVLAHSHDLGHMARLRLKDVEETLRVLRSSSQPAVAACGLWDSRMRCVGMLLARHRRAQCAAFGVWRQRCRTAAFEDELMRRACHPSRLEQI